MGASMKAGLLAASALLSFATGAASACSHQRSADAAAVRLAQASDAARPARGPQSESSVSTNAPPASTTTATGATNQPPAVKQMNEEEKQKVEKEGK
jgi:hypothetical protein